MNRVLTTRYTNCVKLIYENKETGKREVYMVKDSAHINEWGLLQYLEKVDNPANARMQAEAMLTLYNQKAESYPYPVCLAIYVCGAAPVYGST